MTILVCVCKYEDNGTEDKVVILKLKGKISGSSYYIRSESIDGFEFWSSGTDEDGKLREILTLYVSGKEIEIKSGNASEIWENWNEFISALKTEFQDPPRKGSNHPF